MLGEYDALRREIEARINRETVWKAVNAFLTDNPVSQEDFKDNQKHIDLLGRYIVERFQPADGWEQFYKREYKDKGDGGGGQGTPQ